MIHSRAGEVVFYDEPSTTWAVGRTAKAAVQAGVRCCALADFEPPRAPREGERVWIKFTGANGMGQLWRTLEESRDRLAQRQARMEAV